MRWGRWFLSTLLVCLTISPCWAQDDVTDQELIQIRTPETKIDVVAVPPRLINEGLVDTTIIRQSTSGLPVVGIGEQVYVAAVPGALSNVTNFAWSIAAPTGSAVTTLADAPKVGKTFTPDVAGDYVVSLTMTHDGGTTPLTQTITAASYVGVDRCGLGISYIKTAWEGTKHAQALTKKISGFQTGHFQARCISCHSVSSNTSNVNAPTADNGSFWDVAADQGWTFPSSLTQGTWEQLGSGETPSPVAITDGAWNIDLKNSVWDQMPAALKAKGNIQCENCHGPGSAHASGGFANPTGSRKIGLSMRHGVCAKCHDDGHYHVRPHEWEQSGHGKVWNRDSATCAPCHLGSGRIAAIQQGVDLLNGGTPAAGSFELGVTQTCATCHNPHSKANEHQIRWSDTATLKALVPDPSGNHSNELALFEAKNLGTSAACVQCHHMRPTRDVPGARIHGSHQSEMIFAIGGYHYPGEKYPSGGHKYMDDICATCHMSIPARGSVYEGKVGSHSWRMHNDNGTPNDLSDDIFNTLGCQQCHGPIQNFDVNGAQSEIEEMLTVLGGLIPSSGATEAQTNAGWNQSFVSNDGSKGVHNFVYARKLLADALKAMKPADAPAAMAGDFSGDGKVDFTDMFMFTAQFGKSASSEGWDARYDLSSNGVVGFTDWLIFLDSFGNSSAAGKSVLVNNGRNVGGDFMLVGSNHKGIDQEHIGVTLRAVNMTEMRGYGVYVKYDPQVLEFVRAVRAPNGMLTSENTAALAAQKVEEGRLLLADATVGNVAVKGSGALVDLIFRRIGVVGQSSVQIDLAQMADLNFGINIPGAPAQEIASASAYALTQNYPNPFNPATSIRYSLAQPGEVKIVVYNALGQEVRTLVDNYKLSGDYSAQWDALDNAGNEVASGVYMYRMEVNGFTQPHRMVLTR
ncbi:MAG: FlgD immunoglobulin-like domain containing protein [Candidatus Latescibacterota bacterium]